MTREEQRMKALTKAATVLSKLCEVAYEILAVSLTVGFVLFMVDRNAMPGTLVQGDPKVGETLSIHGFSILIANPDGTLNNAAMIIFLLTGAMVMTLMAWVFRNVNLILRTTQGLTKFSKGATPFQKDNVRMVREIGIAFIAITVVEFGMSSVAVMAVGLEAAELSVGMENIVMALLMLCLSQVFALGMKMQEDMDGLV